MSATVPATSAPPRMVSRRARVLSNERLAGGTHHLVLEPEGDWPRTRPGQFVMLSVPDDRFPLLPRPFSLLGARVEDGRPRLEFLVMPVGVGSGLLCSLAPGEHAQVVGPLGGSPLDEEAPAGRVVCVAGGYGIAPFVFLAESGWRRDDLVLVFGARDATRLSLAERAAATFPRVELCTEDGAAGFHGRVDARLEQVLDEGGVGAVLTCGPDPMMEAVGAVCRARGVPARASLETVMGCGYAVCNGCAVAVDDDGEPDGYTYRLACREGTVFEESSLRWSLL